MKDRARRMSCCRVIERRCHVNTAEQCSSRQ
jgi:hypothetical protein